MSGEDWSKIQVEKLLVMIFFIYESKHPRAVLNNGPP